MSTCLLTNPLLEELALQESPPLKTSQLPVGILMALTVLKIHGQNKEDKLQNKRDILSCYWLTVTMHALHSASVYLNMNTSLGFGGCLTLFPPH